MSSEHTVRITAHFERLLEDIQAFLQEAQLPRAYDALLDELTDTLLPHLERFPNMGRPFLERPARSVEATYGVEALGQQMRALGTNGQLREYVMTHYLVLYVVTEKNIDLLSVRHNRQLSFNFKNLWSGY